MQYTNAAGVAAYIRVCPLHKPYMFMLSVPVGRFAPHVAGICIWITMLFGLDKMPPIPNKWTSIYPALRGFYQCRYCKLDFAVTRQSKILHLHGRRFEFCSTKCCQAYLLGKKEYI